MSRSEEKKSYKKVIAIYETGPYLEHCRYESIPQALLCSTVWYCTTSWICLLTLYCTVCWDCWVESWIEARKWKK